MNSGKPSSVPTVPGAFGESPVPSPWATRRISRFISAVVEEDFPVFPEIINTGCGGQCDGCGAVGCARGLAGGGGGVRGKGRGSSTSS